MGGQRKDVWTVDQDQLLVETVLTYIRDGKTQIEAFEEVGKKVNRTSAACGYRWNAVVRKEHQGDIKAAKDDRKKGVKTSNSIEESKPESVPSVEFEDVIAFLRSIYQKSQLNENNEDNIADYKEKVTNLELLLEAKDKENLELKESLDRANKRNDALDAIVGNVREMVVPNK